MVKQNEMTAENLSHHKSRVFRPEKLMKPRDFERPKFIKYNCPKSSGTRPLIVEIGAGKGRHAYLYATSHPEHDIIAIERTLNKFTAFANLIQVKNIHSKEKSVKRMDKLEVKSSLDNLLAVHADAIPYCVYALPAQSVDAFYLLYPNPELKNCNQQWLNMPFFEFLLSRLKPEGKVILASNIEEYIDNAYLQALETWQLDTQRAEVAKNSQRTHFEIKYLGRGETCWELILTKPKNYVTRFDRWQAETVG